MSSSIRVGWVTTAAASLILLGCGNGEGGGSGEEPEIEITTPLDPGDLFEDDGGTDAGGGFLVVGNVDLGGTRRD